MFSVSRHSFFNATTPTSIYTLSLHDALPISHGEKGRMLSGRRWVSSRLFPHNIVTRKKRVSSKKVQTKSGRATASRCCSQDRKSTRLNSSHVRISYADFCLKKKNTKHKQKLE